MADECGSSNSKNTIQIQASPPNVHWLLEHVDVIMTFLALVPIEITLVFHVNQSLVLLIKQSLFSNLLVALWDLERDAFSWDRKMFNQPRNLNQRAEYVRMPTKLGIVPANFKPMSIRTFQLLTIAAAKEGSSPLDLPCTRTFSTADFWALIKRLKLFLSIEIEDAPRRYEACSIQTCLPSYSPAPTPLPPHYHWRTKSFPISQGRLETTVEEQLQQMRWNQKVALMILPWALCIFSTHPSLKRLHPQHRRGGYYGALCSASLSWTQSKIATRNAGLQFCQERFDAEMFLRLLAFANISD